MLHQHLVLPPLTFTAAIISRCDFKSYEGLLRYYYRPVDHRSGFTDMLSKVVTPDVLSEIVTEWEEMETVFNNFVLLSNFCLIISFL